MKIAVLLVGHLRRYDQTASLLIENLLSRYDCDLFITTYNKRFNIKKWYREGRTQNPELTNVEEVKSIYGDYLKEIEVVDEERYQHKFQKRKGVSYHESDKMLNRIKTMLKLINRCGQMMKNYQQTHQIEYDLVIRSRPDFAILKPINLESISWDDQPIYMYQGKFVLSDFFMVGPYNTMIKVLDFSEEWENLKDEKYMRIEWTWQNFFKQKKIKWYLFDGTDNFRIIRD